MATNVIHSTLLIIAQIISKNSDDSQLKVRFENGEVHWDYLVKVGSEHLILPTIYSRLAEKSLLNFLPIELQQFLKELYSINKNRNLTLLKEISAISNLFNEKKIEHVFLKGSALLAGNYFNDLGERMVGDIDILVADSDIKKANSLLLQNNYHNSAQTKGYQDFIHRHLPRLIPKSGLAAVELHHRLLSFNKQQYINPSEVLKHKVLLNDIWIPSPCDLLKHSIYSHQLNNHGYFYNRIHMKNLHDVQTLITKDQTLLQLNKSSDLFTRHYFALMTIYFPEVAVYMKSQKLTLYKLGSNNLKFNSTVYKFNKAIYKNKILISRFKLFIKNAEYRKITINKCRNSYYYIFSI